ncbi:MAG TPA: cation diffusion facilitator family transporter, partial [Anaerolineae bacterium]
VVKFTAYFMTGSLALYSDALESIINVATSIAAIIAIRIAALPPDAERPFGYHKAEYMSAVVVGGLIIAAALMILHEAYSGFLAPKAIDAPWIGLTIGMTATILNAGWGTLVIRQGRLQRSAALVADGKHMLADVVTSLGVLVGVVLTVLTGMEVLDACIAALVALHVLWNGYGILRDNARGLMDEAAPAEELERIRAAISGNATDAIEAHALRTRHAGKATFIDFDLVVPGNMSVLEAHEICDRLEAAIKKVLNGAVVTIHVEPEHKAKHNGIVVL